MVPSVERLPPGVLIAMCINRLYNVMPFKFRWNRLKPKVTQAWPSAYVLRRHTRLNFWGKACWTNAFHHFRFRLIGDDTFYFSDLQRGHMARGWSSSEWRFCGTDTKSGKDQWWTPWGRECVPSQYGSTCLSSKWWYEYTCGNDGTQAFKSFGILSSSIVIRVKPIRSAIDRSKKDAADGCEWMSRKHNIPSYTYIELSEDWEKIHTTTTTTAAETTAAAPTTAEAAVAGETPAAATTTPVRSRSKKCWGQPWYYSRFEVAIPYRYILNQTLTQNHNPRHHTTLTQDVNHNPKKQWVTTTILTIIILILIYQQYVNYATRIS